MNRSERRLMVITAILTLLIGLVLSAFLITANVEKIAATRAEESLTDAAKERVATLEAVLLGQVNSLKLVANAIGSEAIDDGDITEKLEIMLGDCLCESLKFVTPDETVYQIQGDKIAMPARSGVKIALSGKNAVQRSRGASSKEGNIYILVPSIKDSRVMGAVIGSYAEKSLTGLIGSQIWDPDAYVIDSGGNIIIRPQGEAPLSNYSNILNYLAKAVYEKGFSRSSILDKLLQKQHGVIRYSHSGVSYTAAFEPFSSESIAQTDWFVLKITDGARLTDEINAAKMDAMLSVVVFASFSVMAMIMFIVFERSSNKRLMSEAETAHMREERYKLVVAESGREVFQYDIVTGSVHRDNIVYDYFGRVKDIKCWLEFVENSGAADAENMKALRDMFSKIDNGESPVTFDISMTHPNGSRDWNRFHSKTIFSEDGKPVTAVVSYFNCTYLHEREAAYHKWLEEAKRLDKEFIARFNWNVTADEMEEARYEGHPALGYDGASMEKWACDYSGTHIFKDDRAAYRRFFATDRLLGAFEHGVESESIDYREVTKDGYRWLRLTARLTKHPQTGEVKARLLYQNIDEAKRKELDIIAKSEMDSLTGALNREALIKKVDTLIAENPSSTHAVLMLDVDGFKAVNDILGHDEGDETLKKLTELIRGCLRSDDIVGRIGGDEMMVVLRDIPYDAVIKKKARQLCDVMNMRVKDRVDISVSIGIALYPRDANGYDELYKRADLAMYKAKANGKNGYFFYNQFALQQGASIDMDKSDDTEFKREGNTDGRVIYIGDDEKTSCLVKESLSDIADVVITDNKRRAIVAMRYSINKRCVAIADFEALEQTLEVVTACRADSTMRRVPLIATVNAGDRFEIERVMNAGASDYVTRPVSRDELRQRVMASTIRLKLDLSYYGAKYLDFRRDEEETCAILMQATNSILIINDFANELFMYNDSIERMLAGTYDQRPLWRILLSDMVARSTDVKRMQAMVSRLANSPDSQRDEMSVTLKTASNERHRFRFQAIKSSHGEPGRIMLVITDINDSVVMSEKLVFRAERDQLTGLYNADTFFERAKDMINRKPAGFYTILAIDLDNFKSINNQFGRGEGNKILCGLSERLSRAAHGSGGIVSRVAADNFAILCPTDNVQVFENAQTECAHGIERYIDYYTTCVHSGRFLVSDVSMDIYDMYDRALIAKNSIKYRYDVHVADFSDDMLDKLVKEQSIVSEMDAALENGQFEVWYQPQYSILTGLVTGAEALVRWRRPNHGIIPPGEYVALFESNGFIYKLDQFVWHTVAGTLAECVKNGKRVVPVSLNVSLCDICQSGFYDCMTSIPGQYGIDTKLLRLEITESAFSSMSPKTIELIESLRKFGFEIFIDDFGSSASSIGALREIVTDAIKLDGSLLNGLCASSRTESVVRCAVNMAGELNMPVIAKGVESQEQVDYLKEIGCGFIQGYVYCHPMPVSDFALIIESNKPVEHK